MNQLILISPLNLPHVINAVYPRIEAATAYSVGKYKGSDIIQKIASGNMQLWAIYEDEEENLQGVAITEIAVYPQRKICRFLCATGENSDQWIGLIEQIETWALDNGCDGLQAECRPGWERLLKDFGYSKSHVILNKELGSCH